MKWFKHPSDANMNYKLRKMKLKYGMEGYGLYWHCLELIAAGVDKDNITFVLEHDSEIIAHDTGLHIERVEEMIVYMEKTGLFSIENGKVVCISMAKMVDEYINKILRDPKVIKAVLTHSGHSPDKVPPKRREQKRKKQIKKKRGAKRAPQDFQVTIQMYGWAEEELGMAATAVDQHTKEFKDHEFKDAKTAWESAWRNWLRRSSRFAPKRLNQSTDSYHAELERQLGGD